jgi:hypothetical protein
MGWDGCVGIGWVACLLDVVSTVFGALAFLDVVAFVGLAPLVGGVDFDLVALRHGLGMVEVGGVVNVNAGTAVVVRVFDIVVLGGSEEVEADSDRVDASRVCPLASRALSGARFSNACAIRMMCCVRLWMLSTKGWRSRERSLPRPEPSVCSLHPHASESFSFRKQLWELCNVVALAPRCLQMCGSEKFVNDTRPAVSGLGDRGLASSTETRFLTKLTLAAALATSVVRPEVDMRCRSLPSVAVGFPGAVVYAPVSRIA